MKAVPQMVSERIMGWAVLLRAYKYVILYRAGKDHGALSQLPLPENPRIQNQRSRCWCWTKNRALWWHQNSCSSGHLRILRVHEYVLRGWPVWTVTVCLINRDNMSSHHEGQAPWPWPNMDMDMRKVKACSTCQEHREAPAWAPLHPWEGPDNPWRSQHTDHEGPFMGKLLLVIVDVYSKWLEVYTVTSSTSATTINCLRNCFSTHGFPEMNAQCLWVNKPESSWQVMNTCDISTISTIF